MLHEHACTHALVSNLIPSFHRLTLSQESYTDLIIGLPLPNDLCVLNHCCPSAELVKGCQPPGRGSLREPDPGEAVLWRRPQLGKPPWHCRAGREESGPPLQLRWPSSAPCWQDSKVGPTGEKYLKGPSLFSQSRQGRVSSSQ